MKADNVGLREQGVQFDIFAAKLRKLRIVIKIIAEDFHSEAREKPGKDAPDLSSSNDADCLSLEVEAQQPIDGELPSRTRL